MQQNQHDGFDGKGEGTQASGTNQTTFLWAEFFSNMVQCIMDIHNIPDKRDGEEQGEDSQDNDEGGKEKGVPKKQILKRQIQVHE